MNEKLENEKYRLLIVSNECLSESGSNGRTLRNFLIGWPKDSIAQFYIQSGRPDYEVCEKYYCITDSQVLKTFFKRRKGTEGGNLEGNRNGIIEKGNGIKRDAATMLVRELVWKYSHWATKEFKEFISDFSPEIVLLQAGDCAFMFSIAERIAKYFKCPLIIYNSEGYYFKNFDYFQGRGFAHFVYPVFYRYFCGQFKKVINSAKKSIYICEALQQRYESCFHLPSETIYTATDVLRCEKQIEEKEKFVVSYLGNLGVGRHKQLIEVADILHDISEEVFLDVYGRATEEVARELEKCPGIRFKGFVSYDRVKEIMSSSDLLLHVESFTEFYRKDSCYAFSTKLADSLASGTCFLLYAPDEFACAKYLKSNNAAYVVSDKSTLQIILKELKENDGARRKYISSALTLVEKNHRIEKNATKFQKILIEAVKEN